jgi:hypothetical protein
MGTPLDEAGAVVDDVCSCAPGVDPEVQPAATASESEQA